MPLLSPHSDRIREHRDRETPYGQLQQGVAALVRLAVEDDLETWLEAGSKVKPPALVVVLDQVEDPMNLGQILRTCEGAGADAVIVPKHRAVHLTQTAAQISQGAFAWVPLIEVINLRRALEVLKESGLWVFGCENAPHAQPWFECDLTRPCALVFGAEGKGLRQLTGETCDQLAFLPMQGRLGSLNVGASVAALLYEARRQRGR